MTTEEVVQNFYNGLTAKDDTWQQDLSDDVIFSDASKKLQAQGKDAFIQSFTTFLRAVENIAVKQMIVDGEDACAVVSYHYVSPKGERMQQDDAEVWKVVDRKIKALTIYFDITAFRAFMGR